MSRHDNSETKSCFTPEAIMESISDAIIAIDVEKRIQWLNRAAENISGLSRTEVAGRPCSAILRSTMCRDGCALQRSLKGGKPIIDVPAFVSYGGKRIPASISLFLIKDAGGRVVGAVETIRELSAIEQRNQESADEPTVSPLITQSPLMQRVLDQLPAIAASPSTVLILGETGTGKELVARTIHALSPRRRGPFVAVNCGAFPDTLLASELFGYKQGAFTDAKKDRAGRFALAKCGTLFLDDIEAMSPAMQVHLLRVLQEHTFEPVGATRSEKSEARVILDSNEDLSAMVLKGTFRKDLYHRINVARVELPSLRSRKEDIPLLVEQMLERFNRSHGKSIQGVEPAALRLLTTYDWPGNVRELQNAVEHAFIKCNEAIIGIEHLPTDMNPQGAPSRAQSNRSAQAIRAALRRNSYDRSATAKELGIAKTTLLRRMKALRIRKNGRCRASRSGKRYDA